MLWIGFLVGSTHVITFPIKDYRMSSWCFYFSVQLVVSVGLFVLLHSLRLSGHALDSSSQCLMNVWKAGKMNRFYLFLNFLSDISSRLTFIPLVLNGPELALIPNSGWYNVLTNLPFNFCSSTIWPTSPADSVSLQAEGPIPPLLEGLKGNQLWPMRQLSMNRLYP